MKLSHAVAAYVASKQSLGMRFVTEARTLKSFCRAMGDVQMNQVEPQRLRVYLDGTGPVTHFWHRKMSALRGLYRFAIARGYVIDSPLPTNVPQPPQPSVCVSLPIFIARAVVISLGYTTFATASR